MHHLAASYYEREEPDPLKAALHYEQAGAFERAAQLVTADIWALINRGQTRPVGRLLERLAAHSLKLESQVLVHLAYGQVCAFVSDNQPAQESYRKALALLEKQPDSPTGRELKAKTCLGLGEMLRYESPAQALAWLQRGLAELAGGDTAAANHQVEAALHIRAGNVQWSMDNYSAALDSLEQGLKLLPEGPSQWRAIALTNLGNVYNARGNIQQATEYSLRALEISQQLHDHYWTLVILSNLGIAKLIASDWPGAENYCQQALDLAKHLGSMTEQARIEYPLGMLYFWQGNVEKALTYLSQALQLIRRHNSKIDLPYVLNNLAAVKLSLGEWTTAESYLQESEQVALELDITNQLPEVYYLRAQVRLAQRQPQVALADVERALNLARDVGLDREEGISLGILGQVLLAGGQPEPALAAFEQSQALLADRDPYEAARTRLAWGRYLAAGPDPVQGTALLQAARTAFEQLGARRELAVVEQLLHPTPGLSEPI
jgi:tetratricopeptide (TPR) repeat protein